MTETAVKLQPPVMGYFAYWIDRLRIADDLPAALAGRLVRAAIHEAPAACRPPPLEAWPPTTATASTARTSSAGCGCGGCWATTRA